MQFDFRQIFVFLVCASSLISKVSSWFETFSYTGWKLKAGSTRYARDKLECMAQCYRKHGGDCRAASYKDSTYRCRITKNNRPIITRDAQQTLYLHTPALEALLVTENNNKTLYSYSYSEALDLCQTYRGRLMNEAEMVYMNDQGDDSCLCGWLLEGTQKLSTQGNNLTCAESPGIYDCNGTLAHAWCTIL